jgi:hypothetical protein
LVLIDGRMLADLMVKYNVGVQDRETYVIKRVGATAVWPNLVRAVLPRPVVRPVRRPVAGLPVRVDPGPGGSWVRGWS